MDQLCPQQLKRQTLKPLTSMGQRRRRESGSSVEVTLGKLISWTALDSTLSSKYLELEPTHHELTLKQVPTTTTFQLIPEYRHQECTGLRSFYLQLLHLFDPRKYKSACD